MATMTDQEKELAERVDIITCEFYGVRQSRLYDMDIKSNISNARNLSYHILHNYLRISISKIAERYNRKERSVKKQCAIMKVWVENSPVYMNAFKDSIRRLGL